MILMHRGRARVLQRREILAAVHHGSRMDQQIAIRPLLSSQALPAFWQSTSATGLVCRKEDRSGRDGPDDRAEGAGKGSEIGADAGGAAAFRSKALYTTVSSVRALLALSATSSVTTVKRARAAEPNVVEIATSAASRPRAMTIRPIRG